MPDQQNQPQLMNQPQQPQQWGPRGPMQMGEGELLLKVSLSFNFFVVCLKLFLFTNSIGGNVQYLIFPYFYYFFYCCCYISVMINFLNV